MQALSQQGLRARRLMRLASSSGRALPKLSRQQRRKEHVALLHDNDDGNSDFCCPARAHLCCGGFWSKGALYFLLSESVLGDECDGCFSHIASNYFDPDTGVIQELAGTALTWCWLRFVFSRIWLGFVIVGMGPWLHVFLCVSSSFPSF